MLTRSVTRPVRRGPLGAGRAVRAGLALAAVGIAVAGATGGTAFAGPGRFNLPSPDGGAPVRTHGVQANDGDRKTNDRAAGRVGAQPKSKPATKAKSVTKAKARAKARAKAKAKAAVAHRNRVARNAATKPRAAWKAPRTAPAGTAPGGTATVAAPPGAASVPAPATVAPPAAPTAVTVTVANSAAPVLTVSWTVDVSATGIVDHFVASAAEDPTKTCRTRTNAATSCDVKSAAQGATYTFTVRAIGVPGAGDSAPSAASAPATVTAINDGLLVTPATANGTAGTAKVAGAADRRDDDGTRLSTALGSKRVARAATEARGSDKAPGLDKARQTGRTGRTGAGATSEQAAGNTAVPGARMGLPDGATGPPAAAGQTGGRHPRLGTLALLGLGIIAAGLAAFGVTLTRRRPLTD